MIYCISDVHGEYDLFERLLSKIGFSNDDVMYICGDVIDKGKQSLKVAKRVASMPNVHTILGNHEHHLEPCQSDPVRCSRRRRRYLLYGDAVYFRRQCHGPDPSGKTAAGG